jgi:hypothetical protein
MVHKTTLNRMSFVIFTLSLSACAYKQACLPVTNAVISSKLGIQAGEAEGRHSSFVIRHS